MGTIKQTLYDFCMENKDKKHLINEFDTNANGITSKEIGSGDSKRKTHWKCDKGHKWQETVFNRIRNNTPCPYCSGRRVVPGVNDLKTTHPKLCLDWDYEKNELGPENYTRGQHIKVYWKCRECKHEWLSRLDWRAVSGRGCPNCDKGRQTSFPEQVVYMWLKDNIESTKNRFMLDNVEYDIYIPELKLAIEYDGFNTHKGKEERHKIKLKVAQDNGINLLNIVECKKTDGTPMSRYTSKHTLLRYDIVGNYSNINELITNLNELISMYFNTKLKPLNTSILKKAKEESTKKCTTDNSIASVNPEFLKFFDYSKNKIKPDNISKASGENIYWKCPKCGEEYYRSPHYMIARFTGCKCGLGLYEFHGYIENMKDIGAKVKKANVFGSTLTDTSFTKVLDEVLITMYYNDKSSFTDLFTNGIKINGKLKYLMSYDKSIYKRDKKVGDTGLYMEHTVAKGALRIIKEIVNKFNYQGKVYIEI